MKTVAPNAVVIVVRKVEEEFGDGIEVQIKNSVSTKLIPYGLVSTEVLITDDAHCVIWQFKNDPGAIHAKKALETSLMPLLFGIFPSDTSIHFLKWNHVLPREFQRDDTPVVPEKYD